MIEGRITKVKLAPLAALLLGAAPLPAIGQSAPQTPAQLPPLPQAVRQPPEPGSILGYYDPVSGRFTPVEVSNPSKEVTYTQTVIAQITLLFLADHEKNYHTMRCTLSLNHFSSGHTTRISKYGDESKDLDQNIVDLVVLRLIFIIETSNKNPIYDVTATCVAVNDGDVGAEQQKTLDLDAANGGVVKEPFTFYFP